MVAGHLDMPVDDAEASALLEAQRREPVAPHASCYACAPERRAGAPA